MLSRSTGRGCHEVVIVLVGAVEGFAYMDADVSNYIHQEGERFVRGEQRCGAHRAPPRAALTASCPRRAYRLVCALASNVGVLPHTFDANPHKTSSGRREKCAGVGGVRRSCAGCAARVRGAGVVKRAGCGRVATAGALRWRVRAGPSCCRARSRSRGGYRP